MALGIVIAAELLAGSIMLAGKLNNVHVNIGLGAKIAALAFDIAAIAALIRYVVS